MFYWFILSLIKIQMNPGNMHWVFSSSEVVLKLLGHLTELGMVT